MMKGREEIEHLERQILGLKAELSVISRERRTAVLAGNAGANMEARVKSIQKTLENCDSLTKYVNNFSGPLAKDLKTKHDIVREELEHVRHVNSPHVFHEWVKRTVVPVVRQSEQAAHLAASTMRKSRGETIPFHRWSAKR